MDAQATKPTKVRGNTSPGELVTAVFNAMAMAYTIVISLMNGAMLPFESAFKLLSCAPGLGTPRSRPQRHSGSGHAL